MTPQTEEIKLPEPMSNTAIAETYLEADPSKARFAPEVTLQFPLSPRKIVGRDSVIEYVFSVLPGIDDVKLERHMTGGEYAATLWEAQTVWGCLCFEFRRVDPTVRSFRDPRPVIPAE